MNIDRTKRFSLIHLTFFTFENRSMNKSISSQEKKLRDAFYLFDKGILINQNSLIKIKIFHLKIDQVKYRKKNLKVF